MPHDARFGTVSINLPVALVARVRDLAFREEFSVSAIVEQALLAYLEEMPDAVIAGRLRARGAALRRA